MQNKIVIAEPRLNYRLWIEYEDGEAGEVDLAPLVNAGGVFAALSDVEVFGRVQIGEHGRFVEFPDNVDFCADALREKLIPAPQRSKKH